MFLALDARRGGTGFALNPVSHAELEAYTRLHHVTLTPFELGCLAALDRQRLAAAGEAKQ